MGNNIKPRPDESRRGGQNTVVGDTMVKRRHKDREISAIAEIPYFFLSVVGFSRYPAAYAARPWASAWAFVG